MDKITTTISISKDIDTIIRNAAKNFFKNNYSLALESIIRAADENNIEIIQNGKKINFDLLKAIPCGINSIDLRSASYNGSDYKFRLNCSNNFSSSLQTALFYMINVILKYSYRNYNSFNVNNKHFIGFKENASIYQINTDGTLNHGIYINSLKALGSSQKAPRDYIQSNYYPEKKDRPFILISLPELNNVRTNETVFISHMERFTRSNNYFHKNDLWTNIKMALGLTCSSSCDLPDHVKDFLIKKYSNFRFNFNNKNIEALELCVDDIYRIISHFENLL